MVNIAQPIIGRDELDAVTKVMKSGVLAQGPKVAELEAAFAAYCGTKYTCALNSGTAAIHCALFAADVGPGDEVITSAFSFIASVNTILMCGARPVLADIDPSTFNLDPRLSAKLISKKTKAIMPVHLYGQPADWDEFKALSKKHRLILIEDACQAVGAEYKGKKVGSLGEMAAFSLYATKNIMSGEGGMASTNQPKYVEAMKGFRQHGMSRLAGYDYKFLGYNYRMSDLHAAIAVEQLKKADKFNKQRQQNAKLLNEGLKNLPGIITPTVAKNRTHVYHQYTIRVTNDFPLNRSQLAERLKQNGIGSGVYYHKPLHLYPHIQTLGYKKGDFPEAERAAREVLSLPVHPKVSRHDIKKMVSIVKEVAKG